MSKAKFGVWAVIGKILWTIISLVLHVVAKLGSKWARKKLDEHAEKRRGGKVHRVLHPTRR